MTNLRNSSLRVRDIRKLIGSKYPFIKWDLGIQEKGEWVFASLESEENKEKLLLLQQSGQFLRGNGRMRVSGF